MAANGDQIAGSIAALAVSRWGREGKNVMRIIVHFDQICCATLLSRIMSYVILTCFIAFPSLVAAEFVCKSEISYSWKKEGNEELSKVIFAVLEARSDNQELAKAKVESQVLRHTPRASQHCNKEHENLSGCIAAKFTAQASVLDRLSFAARKKLEEAITTDCQARIGACKAVEATEVECQELAEEGDEEKGKEKGKKK
jgi:hypothetical protein